MRNNLTTGQYFISRIESCLDLINKEGVAYITLQIDAEHKILEDGKLSTMLTWYVVAYNKVDVEVTSLGVKTPISPAIFKYLKNKFSCRVIGKHTQHIEDDKFSTIEQFRDVHGEATVCGYELLSPETDKTKTKKLEDCYTVLVIPTRGYEETLETPKHYRSLIDKRTYNNILSSLGYEEFKELANYNLVSELGLMFLFERVIEEY